jgi:hypothetical protein
MVLSTKERHLQLNHGMSKYPSGNMRKNRHGYGQRTKRHRQHLHRGGHRKRQKRTNQTADRARTANKPSIHTRPVKRLNRRNPQTSTSTRPRGSRKDPIHLRAFATKGDEPLVERQPKSKPTHEVFTPLWGLSYEEAIAKYRQYNQEHGIPM